MLVGRRPAPPRRAACQAPVARQPFTRSCSCCCCCRHGGVGHLRCRWWWSAVRLRWPAFTLVAAANFGLVADGHAGQFWQPGGSAGGWPPALVGHSMVWGPRWPLKWCKAGARGAQLHKALFRDVGLGCQRHLVLVCAMCRCGIACRTGSAAPRYIGASCSVWLADGVQPELKAQQRLVWQWCTTAPSCM